MKKRGLYILIAFAIILVIAFSKFDVFDFKKSDNNNSKNESLVNPECSSSIDCPGVSIEKYCENNSSYQKLNEFSCIKGKCVLQSKEPELIAVCSQNYECKEGICKPLSLPIKNCGAYLTKENGFYKLEDDLTEDNLTEACITIKGNNITFDCDGNSITSDSNFSGVYSEENNYLTIQNCEITMDEDAGIGIYLYNNEHSRIINNKLNNQYIGLYLNWENNAIIKGNSIKSNKNTGILIEKASGSELSNNIVCKNLIKDLKIISAPELQGTNNKFGDTDKASNGWPILDEHYSNCTD